MFHVMNHETINGDNGNTTCFMSIYINLSSIRIPAEMEKNKSEYPAKKNTSVVVAFQLPFFLQIQGKLIAVSTFHKHYLETAIISYLFNKNSICIRISSKSLCKGALILILESA